MEGKVRQKCLSAFTRKENRMRIIIASIICLIPITAGAQDQMSMTTTIRGKLKQDRNLEGGVWLLKSAGKK